MSLEKKNTIYKAENVSNESALTHINRGNSPSLMMV